MSVRSVGKSRTVLVAHPFPLVVEALAAAAAADGFEVTRATCIPTMRAAHPPADIAVIASGLDGLAMLRERRGARTQTILLFDQPDPEALLAAVELAAEGLLLTSSPMASVEACITAVAGGEQWLDPDATRLIIDRVAQPVPTLTKRERDVARLVTAGHRNRAIADQLGISEGTVKMHLHNVYAKLGLQSRTQLAMDRRARAG